jgi:hypothetical protein
MLIGDRDQPRQPLKVLHPGRRVVHPGVAGVLVHILQRRLHGSAMGFGDHLLIHVGGERA